MHPVLGQRLAAERIKAMTAAAGEARSARQAHLDALTADYLDAIAGRFAEDATRSIHGTPRIRADTAWRPAGALPPMASGSASIVSSARERVRAKLPYTGIGFALAPEAFTIAALRDTYAACPGHPVSASNLRRVLARRRGATSLWAAVRAAVTGKARKKR